MESRNARTLKISEDMIARQRVLSITRISTIGCNTDGCENDPTHAALVFVVLLDGKRLSVVRHLCDSCSMAMRPEGSA